MSYNVEFLDDNVQFILHAIKAFFKRQKEQTLSMSTAEDL